MYKRSIIIALELVVIAAYYIWIRFTHVGLDLLSASVYLIASIALLFFTLHKLNVRGLGIKIGLAGLLAIVMIGVIETSAFLQESRVRREYPEPCSFEKSPQIPRFKHFAMIIMQCRKDGVWGARTD
jgi:hypothetical protein